MGRGQLASKNPFETRRTGRDRASHSVEVRLDGILTLTERVCDRANRLLSKMLQMKDPSLQRSQADWR